MIDRMATIRRGFLTSRSCGIDRLFEISIKFQSIEDLDAADQELRDALEREKAHEGPLVGDQIPVKNSQEEPRQQSGETRSILSDDIAAAARTSFLRPVDCKRLSEDLAEIRRQTRGVDLSMRMGSPDGDGPWKSGDELLPYHPSASHCAPYYRDGWNHCYAASQSAQALKDRTVRAMLTHYEKWGDTEGFGQMVQAVKELFYPEARQIRGDGGKGRKG